MPITIQDELEQLLEEVMALANSLRQSVQDSPAAKCVSLPAHSVLRILQQQPGLTVPQLSRQRGTSRQNGQILVDRLANSGWLNYIANPDHQRSERLQLTPTGRRALYAANQKQAIRLADLLPHVTEEELRSCSELLGHIRTKLRGRKQVRLQHVQRSRKRRAELPTSAPVAADPSPDVPTQEQPSDASYPESLPLNLL